MRTDLEMGKGKIAAQCSHAAMRSYKEFPNRRAIDDWESAGARKVVVKVHSEVELMDLLNKAKSLGIYSTYIRDAGLTQIVPGSVTVGAIGPANETVIDSITGKCKLL